MAVVVRECTADDVAAIQDIYSSYIVTVATFEEVAPTAEEMEQRRQKVLTAGFPYLVATDGEGGPVMGYAYGQPFAERAAYRYTAEESIYLASQFHGRGVGTVLLRAILERLRAKGIRQVVAVTATEEDNPGTHRLHRKLGFSQVGLLNDIGMKHGAWVTRSYLQMALGEADTTLPEAAVDAATLEAPKAIYGGLGGPPAEDLRPIVVRESVLRDVAAIRAIYCSYLCNADVASFEETPPSAEEVALHREEVLDGGFPYLVATHGEGGPVVGYAYASLFRQRSAYRFAASNAVYLDPGCRGRGAGKALLSALIEAVTRAGRMKHLVARMVSREHSSASHKLHRRLGFVPVTRLSKVGFKNATWLDVEELQLTLEAPELPADSPQSLRHAAS